MDTTNNNITNAANLDALCEALNAAQDAAGETDAGADAYADLDTSDLPTFGGVEPVDTQGIFSWDAGRLLVQGEDGFEIVTRGDEVA